MWFQNSSRRHTDVLLAYIALMMELVGTNLDRTRHQSNQYEEGNSNGYENITCNKAPRRLLAVEDESKGQRAEDALYEDVHVMDTGFSNTTPDYPVQRDQNTQKEEKRILSCSSNIRLLLCALIPLLIATVMLSLVMAMKLKQYAEDTHSYQTSIKNLTARIIFLENHDDVKVATVIKSLQLRIKSLEHKNERYIGNTARLEQRVAKLPRLETRMTEQTALVVRLNASLTSLGSNIQQNLTTLQHHLQRNQASTNKLEQRVTKFSTLETRLSEQTTMVAARLNSCLTSLGKIIHQNLTTLQHQLQCKQGNITRLEQRIAKLSTRETRLSEQTMMAVRLNASLTSLGKDIQQNLTALQQHLQRNQAKTTRLEQKIAKLPTLETRLSEQTMMAVRLERGVAKLPTFETRMSELSRMVSTLNASLTSIDNTIQQNLTALQQLQKVTLLWTCNFDNGDVCDMVQKQDDSYDWTVRINETPSSRTGPASAQSGSHYLYIETSGFRQHGDIARIETGNIKNAGAVCLTFYYNMYGDDINYLQVYTTRDGSSQRTGVVNGRRVGQQNRSPYEWTKMSLNINLGHNNRIGFEGARGSGYQGDIAIDTLRVDLGFCRA